MKQKVASKKRRLTDSTQVLYLCSRN